MNALQRWSLYSSGSPSNSSCSSLKRSLTGLGKALKFSVSYGKIESPGRAARSKGTPRRPSPLAALCRVVCRIRRCSHVGASFDVSHYLSSVFTIVHSTYLLPLIAGFAARRLISSMVSDISLYRKPASRLVEKVSSSLLDHMEFGRAGSLIFLVAPLALLDSQCRLFRSRQCVP